MDFFYIHFIKFSVSYGIRHSIFNVSSFTFRYNDRSFIKIMFYIAPVHMPITKKSFFIRTTNIYYISPPATLCKDAIDCFNKILSNSSTDVGDDIRVAVNTRIFE